MMLTLVTVNFNSSRATIGLLRTLERQTDRDFSVIVVDNDSLPDERAHLGAYAASTPLTLDVIYSDRNRGFSGGNNLAIRKAMAQGSDWILLINPDTTVGPDFIQHIRARTNEPAVLSLPLAEGDRTAYAGLVAWLRPTLAHAYAPGTGNGRYAIGAGMLVHRDVFHRVGLLDENYFLYFEDADFSERARRAGVPLHFLTAPVIRHRTSEITARLGHPLLIRYHARNALRFNWRNGPWWVRAAVPLAALYGAGRQVLKLAAKRDIAESRATLAGIADFVLGRWGHIDGRPVIAVECESIEHDLYGVARLVRMFLTEVSATPGRLPYRFDLYFNASVPDEPFLRHPDFRTCIVGLPRWGLPSSFSLYYYALLPVWLWLRRPSVTYWPSYMLPLIAPGPTVVLLTEDVAREMRNPQLPARYRIAYRIFSTWAARRATRVMAISNSSKAELVRAFGVAPARIAVNELAVRPPADTSPMEGSYLLFVGQSFPRRHLRESILAFSAIAERRPELRFIAIGPEKYDPPVIRDLISRVNRDLGRPAVQHIVHVSDDDLERFYRGASACIYVSATEAFGLPPLEALRYGTPPVLAHTQLNREIYGEHAFYAATTDTDGIRDAMLRALDDGTARQRIREAAGSIVSRYTWKAHADRLCALFADIIAHA